MERSTERDQKGQSCYRCGKDLPPGGLMYVAQIKVFAGFDGILFEPEEGVDQQLERLFEEIEQSNPEELEKEVYQEFHLILCKSCRDRLVSEIEHPWSSPGRLVH